MPNFGGNYTVSDVCFAAISEIIHDLPIDELIPGFDKEKGFGEYWQYVRQSKDNRQTLEKELSDWFKDNREHLVWVPDTNKYRTAVNWKFGDTHPSGGYYLRNK